MKYAEWEKVDEALTAIEEAVFEEAGTITIDSDRACGGTL